MSDLYGKIKTELKKTWIFPLYYKLRGWNAQVPMNADPKHTWVFNAGSTFTGNPKWLFLYVNKYRKDIDAYWVCDDEEIVDYVRSLGYQAYTFASEEGIRVTSRCLVYVVENVKEHIPPRLRKAILLNLFHGVGCKSIERKVNYGFLNERIAKKYITYNEYYKQNQLFLVTSPLMEKHFKEQCGIDDDKVIRAGYPRCVYQKYFDKISTFNHDILGEKGLPGDTRIAVYAPTYRDGAQNEFFGTAIPDMDQLVEKLEEQNMLLIFKMHPFMEKDYEYVRVKERYADCKNLLFWDNTKDIYEIFDQIDLAIVDYSSIFYDMLAAGIPHFIRYFFDYDNKENLRDFVFDVKEMTCGKICNNYTELLDTLGHYTEDDAAERDRIMDLFWSYSSKDSMDKIIDQTLAFEPDKDLKLPTLYSFDIFDTVFSRKVLDPKGIFYYVKWKMQGSDLEFQPYIVQNYPFIRAKSEANVREYYSKTLQVRNSERREITFNEIFDRMQSLYHLNDSQIQALKEWELEAEYDNVIPNEEMIAYIEQLIDNGETVILISDMYLPKDFVIRLIRKVSEKISELPLFLSSDYGVQKTTKKLFIEAYSSFDNYNFKQWKHCGDSQVADYKMPKKLGITCTRHTIPEFNEYEQMLVDELSTYDGYLVAAKMARFRTGTENIKEVYAYAYVSTYYVPYISWCIEDALKRGTKCLYFISRDGHFLKEIADVIIETRGLDMKTRYIYGSRIAWRIPSFIHEIDQEFFLDFGNFAGVTSYEKLLDALTITDEMFSEMFPQLEYVKDVDYIDSKLRSTLMETFSTSQMYKDYIMEESRKDRVIVEDYFRQEINTDEPFAFIEYWGRGYTQECFTRLLQDVVGEEIDVPFYYVRSIYPTIGHNIRYNFTSNNQSLLFTEAIFANVPYQSVTQYAYEGQKVVPVIEPATCDMELYYAMEKCLRIFAEDYTTLDMLDREGTDRALYNFSLDYFSDHQDEEVFTECLAHLTDSVELNGKEHEYAPALTDELITLLENGERIGRITHSLPMTLARSSEDMVERYTYVTETEKEEKKQEKSDKLTDRLKKTSDEKAALKQSECRVVERNYQEKYDQYCGLAVNNDQVLFVYGEKDNMPEYTELKKLLAQDQRWKPSEINGVFNIDKYAKIPYTENDWKLLATTHYIVFAGEYELIKTIDFRSETHLISFDDSFLNILRKEEVEKRGEAPDRQEVLGYLKTPQCFIQAGQESGEAGDTDLFFDQEFINGSYTKLHSLFPESEGKNIILYMPEHRYTQGPDPILKFLNLDVLKKYLASEYVLLTISQEEDWEQRYHIGNNLSAFAKDVTDVMLPDEALAVADIIIGDYRKEFFKSAVLHKPVFCTADDNQTYFDEGRLIYEYDSVKLGPIIADSYDLLRELDHLAEYDYTDQTKYKEKFLRNCDGKIAQRIVEKM